ncbi:hypothetical protein SCACP_02670 [Sporomusa carbonis]|uniref:hypothetical protein n=1 Tax=Sporomusa carbonis TaxID=3076075 RepID=UPI003A6B9AB1
MALFRAHKKSTKAKVLVETDPACLSEECPHNPDLLLLRDAAADERNAIALYLNAARATCMPRLFLDVAEDEMEHYAEIMQEISRLDPVQAEYFREEDLDMLLLNRTAYRPKLKPVVAKEEEAVDVQVTLPDRDDMPTVDILTKALSDELLAANKYQRYMLTAEDKAVKKLFCHLMNEEKEHIAEFTAALFELTHEALPVETG